MRFDRLRLNGFKSFVDPTDLVIHEGLTGVVGPNGCGKSNIIDAVRWVMGESSASRLRGDSLTCLTRDHSVLREQWEAGMIESESSAPIGLKGLLTRAVGVSANVVPDVTISTLLPGDVYLLCSDGLTEMLPDADIAHVLGALGGNPQLAAAHLVDLANDRGGMDNISAVIVSSCESGRLGAELD